MRGTKFLKCPCRKCGGSIEFPAHGIGAAVNCPHCGEKTTLFAPEIATAMEATPVHEPSASHPKAELENQEQTALCPFCSSRVDPESGRCQVCDGSSKRRRYPTRAVVLILLVALGIAGGVAYVKRNRRTETRDTSSSNPTTPARIVSSTPSTSSAETVTSPPAPIIAKSLSDLKVGAIALEKAKGSSLVYAVGVLKNDSDYQRFGVNVELQLTDARGNKVGTAKDYRGVLEPRQEWRFRALVLDSKAVSATVAAIREEE